MASSAPNGSSSSSTGAAGQQRAHERDPLAHAAGQLGRAARDSNSARPKRSNSGRARSRASAAAMPWHSSASAALPHGVAPRQQQVALGHVGALVAAVGVARRSRSCRRRAPTAQPPAPGAWTCRSPRGRRRPAPGRRPRQESVPRARSRSRTRRVDVPHRHLRSCACRGRLHGDRCHRSLRGHYPTGSKGLRRAARDGRGGISARCARELPCCRFGPYRYGPRPSHQQHVPEATSRRTLRGFALRLTKPIRSAPQPRPRRSVSLRNDQTTFPSSQRCWPWPRSALVPRQLRPSRASASPTRASSTLTDPRFQKLKIKQIRVGGDATTRSPARVAAAAGRPGQATSATATQAAYGRARVAWYRTSSMQPEARGQAGCRRSRRLHRRTSERFRKRYPLHQEVLHVERGQLSAGPADGSQPQAGRRSSTTMLRKECRSASGRRQVLGAGR